VNGPGAPGRPDDAGRFTRRPRSTPGTTGRSERARRDADNLRAEFTRLRRWAQTIAARGREAFMDPDDETLYLAAQAVIINLAEALERRTPASVLDDALPEGAGSVRGMRNRLAHDYLFVDKVILWDAVARDAPALLDRVLADEVITAERFLR